MRSAVSGGLLLTLFVLGPSLPVVAGGRAAAQDKPRPAVAVTVDTTEVPELADWGKKARALVEKWHPQVAALLPGDGFTPPAEVRIIFKKDMKGVAYTRGTTIVIAADWVKKHPDDFGMVIHELTHVIQAYRRGGPFWLVEGIADYVRFFHYEPKTRIAINPRRARYQDGYRTAARFLAWVEKRHDRNLVRKLNDQVRRGKYTDKLFQTYTSKSLDELWKDFIASLEKR